MNRPGLDCAEVQEDLWLYLYGEMDDAAADLVDSHLEHCVPCMAALERQRSIHAAVSAAKTPVPDGMLAESRAKLFAALPPPTPACPDSRGWLQSLRGWFDGPILRPAAALGMLAVGFLGGRLMQAPEAPWLKTAGVAAQTRVRTLEPSGDGRVKLVVEEIRERSMVGSLGDERIRELLLAATADPRDPAVRVESVQMLAAECTDETVRHALLAALRRDSNPVVRLKALEALKPYSGSSDVRQALADVLLTDDHPALRSQAIDLLVERQPTDMVDVLQRLMVREQNGYVRQRTERALQAMRVSVETY